MGVILTVSLIILGLIAIALLLLTYIIFGSLIKLQIQRWLLARKGYVEVEHVSETNVRRYFILKPKDYRFDILGGFYHYLPEALTKGGDILKKYSPKFLKGDFSELNLDSLEPDKRAEVLERLKLERSQIESLASTIKKLAFDREALTFRFGMPVLTYYGDNPEPVLFRDRQKIFGAGVIKDAFMRLLLTQRFKDFQKFLMIALISLVVIALVLLGIMVYIRGVSEDVNTCMNLLNSTSIAYQNLVNATIPALKQGSTIVV